MEIVKIEIGEEAYYEANIQNQDITNFWIDDRHYILKSTIKGYKEYEVLALFCSNTDVAKYLRLKKLIIDWTKDVLNKFNSDVEKKW